MRRAGAHRCFIGLHETLIESEGAAGAPGHNRIMSKRLVFLVPGFFGFTSVGAVSYFDDVERSLGHALRRRGVDARIVRCATQPTASIRRRANALRRRVIRSGGLRARELHFVGHSTGGLDMRMLLTPGVNISNTASEVRIARLTKTAISVATPHHGTPLANHFVTLQGQTLLLVLSALATSGQGRGAILAAAKAIALVARLDDWLGRNEGPLDRLAEGILRRIRYDRADPAWTYLSDIERDQGAVLQLTPEGIDLFDAAVSDHAGIDYGCVVAGVPKPREELRLKELLDPEYVVLRTLFRLLHALTARPHPRYPYPKPTPATQRLLDRGLGFEATPQISDGIVPTLSQLHGRVLYVARADHLDVVGHYTLAVGGTADWLPSGAGFTPDAFNATWDAVAAAIARGHRPD
jgi:triacylglycerol lipase